MGNEDDIAKQKKHGSHDTFEYKGIEMSEKRSRDDSTEVDYTKRNA
jgi:hypothetical protein